MEEAELDEDILNTAHILTVQWVRLIRRTRPTDSDIRKVQAPWAHGLKRTHDHDLHCYVKESHLIEVLVLISVCTSMCFLHWLLCTVCNGNSSKHDSQKAKWVKCRIYWFNNGRRKSCILFCSREKFNTAQSVINAEGLLDLELSQLTAWQKADWNKLIHTAYGCWMRSNWWESSAFGSMEAEGDNKRQWT